MLLHFHDPAKMKTKKVQFEATYYARDGGTLEQLKDLTSKRKAVEESINGSSNLTVAIAREMAGGVTSPISQNLQKLEKYIRLLENLVMRVQPQSDKPQIAQWTSDLKLRWTSPLSGSSGVGLAGSKYFRIDDLRFELSMSLSLYAALLRELALEVLSTDLITSAALFRKAAGVYSYLSTELLPPFQPYLPPDRPPEVTSSMSAVMSLVCLAEAQSVAARRAEQKSSTKTVLAKLHYGVVQFLEEAILILQRRTADWTDISEKLKRFVTASSVLHEARCRRYIAEEYKGAERLGMAVGVLRVASRKAQEVKPPSDSLSKEVFRDEVVRLNEMLRKCEHENEFIWRERPPLVDEMPALVGVKIVTASPYTASKAGRELIFVEGTTY